MVFLLSSQYINEEYGHEFGMIPPVFLPIQNKTLLELQIDSLQHLDDQIVLTLPNDFELQHSVKQLIQSKNVEILYLDPGLKLLELFKLLITKYDCDIYRIYYGDTLVNNIRQNDDNYCFTSKVSSLNSWFYINKNKIFAGYLQFANKNTVLNYIEKSNDLDSFLKTITNKYLKKYNNNDIFDFGNLNSYYKNKINFLSSRSFNNISFKKNLIKKSSKNKLKLQAEVNWYKKIPDSMNIYAAKFINNESESYSTEYISSLTLNEYFLNTRVSTCVWNDIFTNISEYFDHIYILSKNFKQASFSLSYQEKVAKYLDNFLERYDQFDLIPRNKEIIINKNKYPSPEECIIKLKNDLLQHKPIMSVIHGDFSLSNIFFDTRTKSIKLIDPRGLDFENQFSINGDINYDYAKFSQFFIGNYDSIISGNYTLNINKLNFEFNTHLTNYQRSVLSALKMSALYKKYLKDINHNLLKFLYISMIPKHSDSKSRQLCFLLTSMVI